MIYVLGVSGRQRTEDGAWYHEECPTAKIISIQRPFTHLSVGPVISWVSDEEAKKSLQEYRKWLFNRLLTNKACIEEFSWMLEVLIQEGDIILQCSCRPPKPCHGNIIKDALTWSYEVWSRGMAQPVTS